MKIMSSMTHHVAASSTPRPSADAAAPSKTTPRPTNDPADVVDLSPPSKGKSKSHQPPGVTRLLEEGHFKAKPDAQLRAKFLPGSVEPNPADPVTAPVPDPLLDRPGDTPSSLPTPVDRERVDILA